MASPLWLQRRVGWWLPVLACLVPPLGAQETTSGEALLEVREVRHSTSGDTTRVSIEVSGDFKYRYERLSNPDRVFFDFAGARPADRRQRIQTITVGERLLRQIRVSETQPGVTRVVLDLAQPAALSVAQLANPDRLAIELRPQGKPSTEPPRATIEPAKPVVEALKPVVEAPKAVTAPPKPAAEAPRAKPEAPAAEPSAAATADRVPLPAKKAQSGTNSLVRALGLKLERVVIDPGHGGHDTGGIGPSGLLEKDLVLDVARRLGALIESRLGAEVIYTRTEDVFVPLEERTALANTRQADLFLSIHANSGVASATGSETYYLNFTTSKTAMEVAARENASSQRSIHELQSLLEKIALKDKVEESREFANRVQAALVKELAKSNSASRDRGVRKAPFVVLIGAAMPSVLSEVAFLSNPREEKLLNREDYRQRIAEGIYQGLSQYASSLSRFQVAEQGKP